MLDLSDTVTTSFPGESHSCSTLNDILRWRAKHQPTRLAYTFLTDGETADVHLTYADLDRQAHAVATQLSCLDVEGERVLLLYPPGLDYISAFFGCLYAGAIAVPVYPPRLNRNLFRLQTIAADAQPKAALTTSTVLSRVEPLLDQTPELKKLNWVATNDLNGSTDHDWREPSVNSNTIAFLQYTSGSTGLPKGVVLTHRNLLHNSTLLEHAFGYTSESQCVSWLPMYHDMGLIGAIIQPLYGGFTCTLMSPISFLQKPVRWLQAITRTRGTISGGPNFAYDLCVRKIAPEERAELDLSTWNVAFNGAEPIRPDTLERFAAAFQSCGFRAEAFHPCYGLAEATLIVSGGKTSSFPTQRRLQTTALEKHRVVTANTGDAEARTVMSCGGVLPDEEVRIVHPEFLTICLPDEVGEIWVHGPSVAQGYWNRDEENEHTFRATLPETGEKTFLRTGDLGFVDNGQLFVTGRLKDLIIIRGLNHYPQDIELTVEQSHPAFRPGGGAAFSVEQEGEERLIVVHELRRGDHVDIPSIFESIRRSVAEEHELQVHAVQLLKPGSIPKTSSGKIQRTACRSAFLNGTLNTIEVWATPLPSSVSSVQPSAIETVEQRFISLLAGRLGLQESEIDVSRPITHYGLDSLMAIELMHELESALGIRMSMTSFFDRVSISELAARAAYCRESMADIRPAAAVEAKPVTDQPLSYGQQSLWFMYQLASESAAYNISACVRVRSKLDVAALRRAFQILVDRHQSLRSTFPQVDGKPVQRVHNEREVSFEQYDASGWSDTQLSTRLSAEAHKAFNLEQGPLFRICLFTRDHEKGAVLLLVVHHIIMDLWSLAILLYELGQVYSDHEVRLPPLGIHYSDYVRWETELLEGPQGERLWEYWRAQLSGELPLLNLPTDRPRPLIQTFRGSSHTFKIDVGLTERLKALAREQGATLYMVLLAAYQALLYRYTGQHEIIVGTFAANRNRVEMSNLVGFFTNLLALRCHVESNLPFTDLIAQTRRTTLGAFEHQEYPFPLIVKRLQPERDASRQPIFQTVFVLHKTQLLNEEGIGAFALEESGAQMKLGELSLESVGLEQRVAQFDLLLRVAEVEGHLTVSFEYLTDLFDAATISRMAGSFVTLLKSLTAEPSLPIARVPLLTAAEQRQLREWNAASAAFLPRDRCLHEMFQEQVERTPDQPALVAGAEQLTYLELNRRANQLAHHLRSLGVGPESLVGVLMERSPQMVVALLAILKAGGAYVPLDTAYPKKRISFMLEDAAVSVLLTQQHLSDQLPTITGEVIAVDTEWETISQRNVENPVNLNTPDNLAYVIYTSGSTGQPKGVAIEHHSVVTTLRWAQSVFPVELLRGVLASTSICFDLSVFELFVPLSCGGRIILVQHALELGQFSAAAEVTLVNTVPSAAAELVRAQAIPESVKIVTLCGEVLTRTLVEQLYSTIPDAEVYNLYGPSEDTIYSTYALMNHGETGAPAIGKPISNTQTYVLDSNGERVPVGVAGELYLGGNGLARGYLRRPALTAERFVPDPFSRKPGARMYRTGDVSRFLADGNLEFLGRIDQQVKIRGYRIELGEIEAIISEHPAVREAVVLAREDVPGEKRLVCYLVLNDGSSPVIGELRQFLKQKLPDYMVPSAFINLPQLPLTANGKLDRRALPGPEGERPNLSVDYEAPRCGVEEKLVSIWAEVLGVEQVGIHDNFFELGGDSILSIRIISRATQAGLNLSPLLIFQHQTIAELAPLVAEQPVQSNTPTERSLVTGPLPLTPIQQWFFSQELSEPHHWNHSLLLLSKRYLRVRSLRRIIDEVQRHHDALRLRFTQHDDGRWEQHNAGAEVCDDVPLLVVDLSAVDNTARQPALLEQIASQAQASLDLTHGPLWRVVLFQYGAGRRQRLLLIAHHLVIDAASWRILLEDMVRGYEQSERGEDVSFGAKTTSYQRWAKELESYAGSAEVQGQIAYWQKQCERAAGAGVLPVADVKEQGEQVVTVELDEADTRTLLRELTESYRVEIEELLLCAVLEACRRSSGKCVQVIEVETHGREEISPAIDVTRTIGSFTTKYPLVVELSASGEVMDTLKRVKEELRQAPGRGIGYGLLRYLSEDADVREGLKPREVWQMSFNYLGQLDEGVKQFEIERRCMPHERAGSNTRSDVLNVRSYVLNGRLRVEWVTSRRQYREATIRRLGQEFLKVLQELKEKSGTMDGFIPSDFPNANISQAELEKLLLKIS
jgi:amino acid adenylation domain-containing protein/non-ribosomal peptide synthase protein (TIGR01720 family)